MAEPHLSLDREAELTALAMGHGTAEERATLEAHVASCAECAAYLAEQRGLAEHLAGADVRAGRVSPEMQPMVDDLMRKTRLDLLAGAAEGKIRDPFAPADVVSISAAAVRRRALVARVSSAVAAVAVAASVLLTLQLQRAQTQARDAQDELYRIKHPLPAAIPSPYDRVQTLVGHDKAVQIGKLYDQLEEDFAALLEKQLGLTADQAQRVCVLLFKLYRYD